MEPEGSLPRSQVSGCTLRNKIRFYGEELLAPRPTSKLEEHPLSAVRECLFNIFAATLHIGDRSSILNLRTPRAPVTGTHLSHGLLTATNLILIPIYSGISVKIFML